MVIGSSAKAMMHNWQFVPAIKDGRTVATQISYTHYFNLVERDNNINEETQRVIRALRRKSSNIVEMDALDARPKLVYQPQFNDPRNARAADAKPDIVHLEFIIDTQGQVQAPRIVSATDMDLAWSIATITGRWLYDVPMLKGDPAMVRHEMIFEVP